MRTIDHVDAEAFEHTLKAARAASDADEPEKEAELLRQVLAQLVGGLPKDANFPEAALDHGLQNASPTLARWVLDISLELAGALIKFTPFDAIPWVEFVAENLGAERNDHDSWFERMHVNLLAAQGVLTAQLSENSPARTRPTEFDPTRPARGARTVQRLAQAMSHARRLANEGDTSAAISLINDELSALDITAPMANEVQKLAQLLCRELVTPSLQVKRECCRQAYLIMRERSSHESVTMLLRCAGYARDAKQRDLAWEDLIEAYKHCNRPGAQALCWSVLNYMGETEMNFGHFRTAICLMKLALREYHQLRQELDERDPQIAQLTPIVEMSIDRLVDLLIETGRLDEAEQVAQIRLAPDISSTSMPPLTSHELRLEVLFVTPTSHDIILKAIHEFQNVPHDDKLGFDPSPHPSPATASLIFLNREGRLHSLLTVSGQTFHTDLNLSVQEANHLAYRVRRAVISGCSASDPILREGFDALLRRQLKLVTQARILRIGAIGGLRNLPWAALHDGNKFLVESFTLQRLSAPTLRPIPIMADKVILVSFAASRGNGDLAGLGEGAINEARAVAALAEHGHAVIDEAFAAGNVESAMRAANIVHFATHFVPDAATPESSRLLMGNGEFVPLKRLVEMSGDSLNLLILSCCASAIEGSEEDHSIENLVLLGGVGAVFGTLWHIDSAAMALLVPAFVEGLSHGFDKAEALAQVQRSMIYGTLGNGRFRLPCFFAGSIIAGDTSPWRSDAFRD